MSHRWSGPGGPTLMRFVLQRVSFFAYGPRVAERLQALQDRISGYPGRRCPVCLSTSVLRCEGYCVHDTTEREALLESRSFFSVFIQSLIALRLPQRYGIMHRMAELVHWHSMDLDCCMTCLRPEEWGQREPYKRVFCTLCRNKRTLIKCTKPDCGSPRHCVSCGTQGCESSDCLWECNTCQLNFLCEPCSHRFNCQACLADTDVYCPYHAPTLTTVYDPLGRMYERLCNLHVRIRHEQLAQIRRCPTHCGALYKRLQFVPTCSNHRERPICLRMEPKEERPNNLEYCSECLDAMEKDEEK